MRADFKAWLCAEGYADTSVTKILRDVATMAAHGPVAPNAPSLRRAEALRWAWSAWDDFCGEHNYQNDLVEPPRDTNPRRRRLRRGAKRGQLAESIDTSEWHRLLTVVEADERVEARVIDVQCSTALRIGDVLRSSRSALERGLNREDGLAVLEVKNAKPVIVCVRGGPEREWRRLVTALKDLTPRALVCEAIARKSGRDWSANGAAYRQIDRYLKRLGEQAGVTGRVHTHRIRRTVAIQAALAGVDRFRIQKLLNHESGRTTDIYLDENMAREAAAVAAIVRGR